MVEEHIKDLLHEHDCVIIPDFGGLISHYASARIHPVKHTLVPPSRRIAFNEKLRVNDGLLINSLVQVRQVTTEQAQRSVADFVGRIREELQERYKFEMRGIGLFRLNREQKVEFEYIETENLLDDSFGLPELVSRPVLPAQPIKMRNPFRDRPATAPAPERKTLRTRLNHLYRVAAAVVIGSVAFSGLYYLSQQPDATLSSLNPMTLFVPDQNRMVLADDAEKVPMVWSAPLTYSAEEIRDMHLEYFPTGHIEALYSEYSQLAAPSGEITWEEYTDAFASQEIVAAAETLGNQPEAASANEDGWNTSATGATAQAVAGAPPKEESGEAVPNKEPIKAPEVKKPEATVKETVKAAPAPAKKAATGIVKASTGRYYVIGGGFSSLAKAKEIQTNLKKTGLDPKIILPTSKGQLHRVSLADFDNRETAVQAMKIFKTKHGSSIWVLTY